MKRVTSKEWSDALRSGEYQQGKDFLHEGNRFCCLGVLCDLFDPDGWTLTAELGNIKVHAHPLGAGFGKYEGASTLAGRLGKQFPIGDPVLEQELGGFVAKLSRMNDVGESFLEIADYIDEEIPDLVFEVE